MPVAPAVNFALGGLQPFGTRVDVHEVAVKIQPGITALAAGAVLGECTTSADAVHTIACPSATSGTFKLSFRGYTTSTLNFNSTASAIATALNALPSIGASGVAGTGNAPNNASSGSVITWSGTLFAKTPVELPTITVVTTFDVALTIVSTTVGSQAGYYGPYDDSASNGLQVAKALNKYLLSTDGAGNITFADSAVGEEFKQTRMSAPVYTAGEFRCEDLVQSGQGAIDANGVADLGRIVNGTSAYGILRLR